MAEPYRCPICQLNFLGYGKHDCPGPVGTWYIDHVTGKIVHPLDQLQAAKVQTTAVSVAAEPPQIARQNGEPEWTRFLDPERQAYLRKIDEYGYHRWANVNGTNELLMQLITDLRRTKLWD